MLTLLVLACAEPAADDSAPDVHLPGHNECLPEGQEMDLDVCRAVVEDQGRYPTVSENKSGDVAVVDDPRAADPELRWLTSEVKRCTCSCCHHRGLGGAGVYFWDLDWTPVWTDSASLWTFSVFGGWTEEERQTLPTSDLPRLQAYLEGEADRRREARDAQDPY